MIKIEQFKICPTTNPNFEVTPQLLQMLIETLPSIPILIHYDNYNWDEDFNNTDYKYQHSTIIGIVASHTSIFIQDNYLTADIYLLDDVYKDYVFVNYELIIRFKDNDYKKDIESIRLTSIILSKPTYKENEYGSNS